MSVVRKIVAFLKREPVAAYGTVVAAVLSALASVGVPATDVEVITGILVAFGVPVVRSQVSPTAKPANATPAPAPKA